MGGVWGVVGVWAPPPTSDSAASPTRRTNNKIALPPFITWPLTPDSSRLEVYTLFPREHIERPDFTEHVKKYHDFMSQVVDEDREMVQSMQRNLGSRLFAPGRMSRHEENIHNTINGYLEHVFGRPG